MFQRRVSPVWAPDDAKGGGGGDTLAGGGDTLKGGGKGDDTLEGDKTVLSTGGDDTLKGGKGSDTLKAVVPGDDWRDQLAGDNAKFRKELERYPDWRAYALSGQALRTRLSAGELRAPFPSKGTDEEKASWRQQNGYPAKPEELLADLGEGITIGEDDKPLAMELATAMHQAGIPKDGMAVAMRFYYTNLEKQAAETRKLDDTQHTACIQELTTAWGKDYGPNSSIAKNTLALGAAEVKDAKGNPIKASLADRIMQGRLGDGTLIGDDPDFMKFIAQLGRGNGVMDSLIGDGSGSGGPDVAKELASLRADMRKDRNAWFKAENLPKRERYKELLEAQERIDQQRKAG